MAAAPVRDAEAMMDEVALLEQALREAVERRRGGGCMDTGSPVAQPFDTAVATYGVQLRAWIDLQVDSRLSQVLPGLMEAETAAIRQESFAAMEAAGRSEVELRAGAETQARLLVLVEGVSQELERLKAGVAACQLGARLQTAAAGGQGGVVREETLASLEKVRERLEELSRSSCDRVEELSRGLDELSRTSHERFEELARDLAARRSEGATERLAQQEEVLAEARRSQERQDGAQQALQRLQQELGAEGRRLEGLERQVAAASGARVDFEARLEARLEALRAEVVGARGAKMELEACLNRASADLDGHVEAQIEARLEAWQFEGKLESRMGGLRAELEERLDSQARVRLEALRLESKQDLAAQLGEAQENIESHFRTCVEAVRLESKQDLREQLQEVQDRIESRFKLCLEAERAEGREDLKGQIEESQARFGEDLVALQQRLVTELRAETTAALSRESAAIAALDEQLWITDQRLGQRIDELAHLNLLGRASLAERLSGCKERLDAAAAAAKQRSSVWSGAAAESLLSEDSGAERRRESRSPSRRESGLGLGLGLGLGALGAGSGNGGHLGSSLVMASLAGKALAEAAHAGADASTEEPEEPEEPRPGGARARPRLEPGALFSRVEPLTAAAAAEAEAGPAPLPAPLPARSSSLSLAQEATRLSPRSASNRLFGSAWRGSSLSSACSARSSVGAARGGASRGSAGAAAAALAARADRRELRQLQDRRRSSAALDMASKAAEALAEGAHRAER